MLSYKCQIMNIKLQCIIEFDFISFSRYASQLTASNFRPAMNIRDCKYYK